MSFLGKKEGITRTIYFFGKHCEDSKLLVLYNVMAGRRGGTGRRPGLKILCSAMDVRVRFPSSALMDTRNVIA